MGFEVTGHLDYGERSRCCRHLEERTGSGKSQYKKEEEKTREMGVGTSQKRSETEGGVKKRKKLKLDHLHKNTPATGKADTCEHKSAGKQVRVMSLGSRPEDPLPRVFCAQA